MKGKYSLFTGSSCSCILYRGATLILCHHTNAHRLKEDLWKPIANEIGVPWRAAEAMHWDMGQNEMAHRANVSPFTITAARATQPEPGSGRIAQRDRMLQSTKVFEGQNLGNLNSSFAPINSNYVQEHAVTAPGFVIPFTGMPSPAYVHIAPIKNDPAPPSHEERGLGDDEDGNASRTPKVKREKGVGEMRLPGFSELDGNMQAVAEGREVQSSANDWVMVQKEGMDRGRRRSSGGSGGSQ